MSHHLPRARQSSLSSSSLPVLALDNTAELFSDSSLSEILSWHSTGRENDPFLVKSPHQQCAPRRVINGMNSEMSFEIKNLQNFHDIDPTWRDDEDEVEEIMVLSPKRKIPQVVKLSNANDVFHLLSVVGTGITAKILLAKKPHSFKLYAIKRMRRSLLSTNGFAHSAISEQLVLRTMTHLDAPFLPRLHSSFTDSHYLYLVTDFCARGDLLTHLLRDGALSPEGVRFYASELVLGIASLHSQGIIHRDLKPENVLVDLSGHLVITDFGCAKLLNSQGSASGMPVSSSFCGTREYQAPEMVLEWPHDFAVDIWGFGMLLYLMQFGQHPFMQDDDVTDASVNLHHKILLAPIVVDGDSAFVNVVEQCLQRNPALRLKIDGVQCHRYFSSIEWKKVASKQISVPQTRILDISNIHIPLSPTETISYAAFASSDTLDTPNGVDLQRSDGTFDKFSFEWSGVSQEDTGLAGQVDPVESIDDTPSLDHVPTLLNAIEEVSEEEEILRRSIITTAFTAESNLSTAEDSPHGEEVADRGQDSQAKKFPRNRGTALCGKILDRCRKLPSFIRKTHGISIQPPTEEAEKTVAGSHRPRNKLRKRTRLTVVASPADIAASVPLGPAQSTLSITATTYAFCRPTAMFSWKKLRTRKKPEVSGVQSASSDTLDIIAGVVRESQLDTDSEFGWRGSEELRLCRRHRLH